MSSFAQICIKIMNNKIWELINKFTLNSSQNCIFESLCFSTTHASKSANFNALGLLLKKTKIVIWKALSREINIQILDMSNQVHFYTKNIKTAFVKRVFKFADQMRQRTITITLLR